MGMRLASDIEARALELAGLGGPLPDDQTEAEFQASLVKRAQKLGWLAYHTHDSRKSAAGFWDTTLIRGRVLIGAELKVGDNQPTGPQLTWLEALAGVQVVQSCVWRPEMWPEIERTLRGDNS